MFRKVLVLAAVFLLAILSWHQLKTDTQVSGAPPYGESLEETPTNNPLDFSNWVRPPGPPKVALQVGHWQNDQAPDELHRLRNNSGASGGGKSEWEVNYEIANLTADLLRAQGIIVDILPTTIPPSYWADAFVAIHADGSTDSSVNGYKVAPPWRDFTGHSNQLSQVIHQSYGQSTKLAVDPNISRNMRGYYAFAFWRYEHAIHPMTPAAILETGFLTSPNDRLIIVNQPQLSAQGLSQGILSYLQDQNLLADSSF